MICALLMYIVNAYLSLKKFGGKVYSDEFVRRVLSILQLLEKK